MMRRAWRCRLRAGERFLAMFDDGPPRKTKQALGMPDGAIESAATAAAAQQPSSSAASSGRAESDTEGRESSSGDDGPAMQPPAAPGNRVIEYIFDSRRVVLGLQQQQQQERQEGALALGKPGAAARAAAVHVVAPAAGASVPSSSGMKVERKRFMSSKAGAVAGGEAGLQDGAPRPGKRGKQGQQQQQAVAEEGAVSRAEFMQMQREVHLLGGPVACCCCSLTSCYSPACCCYCCRLHFRHNPCRPSRPESWGPHAHYLGEPGSPLQWSLSLRAGRPWGAPLPWLILLP